MDVKVRFSKTNNEKFKCWLDAGGTYYYGRSYLDMADLTPDLVDTEKDIESYLKQQGAFFVKDRSFGCLPEWTIKFKNPQDVVYFSLKWVDK